MLRSTVTKKTTPTAVSTDEQQAVMDLVLWARSEHVALSEVQVGTTRLVLADLTLAGKLAPPRPSDDQLRKNLYAEFGGCAKRPVGVTQNRAANHDYLHLAVLQNSLSLCRLRNLTDSGDRFFDSLCNKLRKRHLVAGSARNRDTGDKAARRDVEKVGTSFGAPLCDLSGLRFVPTTFAIVGC